MENFELNPTPIKEIQRNFNNSLKFKAAMFSILPMGFLAKMKIKSLTDEKCEVTVPYNRRNKNPFKSTFWAVLGMAAEMSSGALLTMYTFKQKPSIAMIIVNMDAEFVKKATGLTTFVCNDGLMIRQAVETCVRTNTPQEIKCKMTGYNPANEAVAHFTFTWSIKARS